MKMLALLKRSCWLAMALLACFAAAPCRAQRVTLAMTPRGAGGLTRLRPVELTLSAMRPAGISRVPKGLSAPYYTAIVLGPKESPSRFTVIIDAPEGRPSRLFVDANGNGDMLDDPAPEWNHKTVPGGGGAPVIVSNGGATLQVKYGARTVPVHVALSRNDTDAPARAAQFLSIYCSADYAREGVVSLGGKSYHVWLTDALSRGDYRGSGRPGQSGIFLLIDVNG